MQDGAVIAGTFTAEQDALVITVAALSTALPGTGQTSAKVTPLSEFPTKGRGGQGVRAQRFLKDEDCLEVAGVLADPRAVDSAGSPVELPDINPKRDGSGSPLLNQIASIG